MAVMMRMLRATWLHRFYATLVIFGLVWTTMTMWHLYEEEDHFLTMESQYFRCEDEECQKPKFLNSSVILLSTYRSGSSFVGEFLKQNPDFYYLFEPLKMLTLDPEGYKYAQKVGPKLIQDVLQCNFRHIFSTAWKFYSSSASELIKLWEKRSYCDKLVNRACFPMTVADFEIMCKKRKYVAVKEITLFSLKPLIPILQQGGKFIHLVRDPRGVVSSVKAVDRTKGMSTDVESFTKSLCARFREQMRVVNTHIVNKFPGYKLMRYEDFAIHPRATSRKLYSFLNLTIPGQVRRWIRRSTLAESYLLDQDSKPLKFAYSTKRDSRETAISWRVKLKWAEVERIQRDCSDILDMLGYVTLSNESEMRDLHISTVRDLSQIYA